MTSIEMQQDLEARQYLISEVTAYSSLRAMLKILCNCYIGAAVLWLLFNIVLLMKSGGPIVVFYLPMLVAALISILFALVVKGLALAFLDGVDLKLLDNRRSELNRKEVKE